jgi:uncharacterized phage protein gp47/JayE
MSAYVDPELLNDETAVAEGNLAAIRDLVPSWIPPEGGIETAFAEALAIGQATVASLVIDDERNRYAGFGEVVLSLPRGAAAPARSQATITAIDTLGHLIPAGFQFVCATPSGDPVPLITTVDALITAGATTVTGVLVQALETGIVGNGASGLAIDRDDIAFVQSIQLEQPTAGGIDEEALSDYVSRVVFAARRRSFLPITPADYARVTLDVPGVGRALAINRQNPATAPADAPGHVTIIVATSTGAVVPTLVKTAIDTYFASLDQVRGSIVHVVDVTIQSIAVAATVKAAPGVTSAAATAAATAAIQTLLSPATYNADPDAAGGWKLGQGTFTIFDVDRVLSLLTASIAQVQAVTINGGTAAVTVPATALVTAGAITITVT